MYIFDNVDLRFEPVVGRLATYFKLIKIVPACIFIRVLFLKLSFIKLFLLNIKLILTENKYQFYKHTSFCCTPCTVYAHT